MMTIPTSVPVMSIRINDGSQSTSKFPVASRERFLYNEASMESSRAPSNRRHGKQGEKSLHIDESGFSMSSRSEPALTRDLRLSAHRIH
jgi:hypothetical protein